MKKNDGGFLLVGVLAVMLTLVILIPALVSWVSQESKWSVKEQKNTTAYNFAEAGMDRAFWKLKSSTTTWYNAKTGTTAITDYNFDRTFTDVDGGTYRIKISSGPSTETATVIAEGRDAAKKQTRAIQATFTNISVPGALISGGLISESGTAVVHWGPMMAMNNITLSGSAASRYFPRKLSKQVVIGTAGNPRDVNGLTPPNTDNLEWWSDYDVPELPIFDFSALRSSAAATGTLNCNGQAKASNSYTIPCGSNCTNCSIQDIYKDNRHDDGKVWFWDHNVSLSGQNGVKGTVMVLGNMSTNGSDSYNTPNVHVPANAWKEYQKIDTSAANQYPADLGGPGNNGSTYDIGSCGVTCEGSNSGSDVGFWGFVYVGGTIDLAGDSDVYGAVWVVSGWSGTGNVMIFYNDQLTVPQTNVTIERMSWQEVPPSGTAWAP